MAGKSSINHQAGVSELFHAGWSIQKQIENSELVATSKEFSEKIKSAIGQLEEATRLVNELNLFSKNETVEEIATNDLKYVLLPALLGHLVSQLMDDNRLTILNRAQVYFIDFLQRCKDYAITNEEVPSYPHSTIDNTTSDKGARGIGARSKTIQQLELERREKIARLKAKKQTECALKELNRVLESCDSSRPVDEDTVREHILTLLKLWVYKAVDDLGSIKQELELLEQMKQFKQEIPDRPRPSNDRGQRPPLKPFVITKEMLKNQVFGAGYPSLPSMTVEEFYQQNYENMPTQQPPNQREPEVDSEDKEETEEEEKDRLRREREFDDFKDVNRRGWGNRKNQG